MNVSVTGKQIEIGEALQTHVAAELDEAVAKYFTRAIEAQVTFSRDGSAFYRADIQVHVGRNIDLQGHATADDPYLAFDRAQDRIAKRLRRYKRRLREHKGPAGPAFVEAAPFTARQYVIEAGEDSEEAEHGDQPVVIAETTTEIPRLTVGEAVMRMDLSDAPALLFRNGAHGGLNLVYKRNDGNIGWIDPGAPDGRPGTGRE